MAGLVARVQDLDNIDAIQEGWPVQPGVADINGMELPYTEPKVWFAKLWDSINAKRGYSWKSNPWVWVVEFEVLSVKK